MAWRRRASVAARDGNGRWGWFALPLVFACALAPAGCTRKYYRVKADKEVDGLIAEKDQYPFWKVEQYHVYPDPRARFADPTNPDRPPMPPDDPAARDLSPNPQKPGKAGIAFVEGQGYLEQLAEWDAVNRAAAEARKKDEQDEDDEEDDRVPPTPVSPAPLNPPADAKDGQCPPPRPKLITLEQAVELGQFNSREFQDRRENLYLVALPVTLQRFAFTAQAFAAEQAIREVTGKHTPEGQHNRWVSRSNLGFGKLFSTGALLLFNVANETFWEFGNVPRSVVSSSTLSLDLVQPFLQGGGKAVTLEPLTQAERNLVYEMRTYARFRKEFFVAIAGGGGGSISGGTFVPTGVIVPSTVRPGASLGGSGLFPGFPPPVQLFGASLQQPPGQSGSLNLTGAIPAPVSGYLGTLLEYAQITIDRDNIANLQRFLQLFRAFKEGGDVSQLQVDQVEQQLLQGRSQLLTDEQQYGDSLDRLRLQLGLRTNEPLALDDAPLRPLRRQFRRYEQIFEQFDAVNREASRLATSDRLRAGLRRLATQSVLVRGTRFQKEFPSRWASWERETADGLRERVRRLREERRALLDRQTDAEQADRPFPEAEQARLQAVERELDIAALEEALREYEARPWTGEADPARRERRQLTLSRVALSAFVLVLGQVRNERLEELRNSWPALPRLCVQDTDLLEVDLERAYTVTAQTALSNRLDLMNARGQLVDAWRQLAVFANALLGVANVQYHWDSFTPPTVSRPLAFGGSGNRHQLILTGSPPLVRQAERNNYRASLIAYQRQRRALMEAEDLAVQAVRGEVRQLRVLAENYRIQQRQVELAYLTVENSLDTFQQPPAPGTGQSTAAQAAALTNQLLQAQSRLPTAQAALLSVWISYLNTRLQLYRDLELMPLDARGVWVDDVESCLCPPARRSRESGDGGERLPPPRRLPPAAPDQAGPG